MGKPVSNLVVVSDIHAGCKLALCPTEGVRLDEGGLYKPRGLQRKLWAMWQEFWDEWVPMVTHREPYAVCFNGDALDGVHHGSTTQISHNLADQARIAKHILQPVVDRCKGRYYHIRGTESHVGKSAAEEERLAEVLGAIPNGEGQYARYDLWKRVGPFLGHLLHHIGTTGSQAYEATAVHKELVEEFVESARWDRKPPDFIVRSHRHRLIRTSIPTAKGDAFAVVTPCWQGKTPFVWKIPGGRLSTPQFGGIVIRVHKGELYIRHKVWTVDRSRTE